MPLTPFPPAVSVPMPGRRPTLSSTEPEAFTIDCADCMHHHTAICEECVVSFIVGRQPEDAIVIDADEARAVRMLEHAGLVPGIRHSQAV